jgi:hypothetical protein
MEILKFLQWRWHTWELWQRWYVCAMLVQIVGWFVPGAWGTALVALGFAVPLFFMLKWFVWEPVSASWLKYKQHRNQLLTTIKTSCQTPDKNRT